MRTKYLKHTWVKNLIFILFLFLKFNYVQNVNYFQINEKFTKI